LEAGIDGEPQGGEVEVGGGFGDLVGDQSAVAVLYDFDAVFGAFEGGFLAFF
jgi:hypothetical protein